MIVLYCEENPTKALAIKPQYIPHVNLRNGVGIRYQAKNIICCMKLNIFKK